MADLELRKRIELELLRFALKYAEEAEIGERLWINADAGNYVHREVLVHADREPYLQFYLDHKRQKPLQLTEKIELYVKATE